MKAQVLPFDSATHKVVDVLLPWLVNGTLEGDELALVHAHLAKCERCQREVEWLRELHAACAAAAAPDASPAVRSLRERLLAPRRQRRDVQTWWRAAVAAQLAAIIVLAAVVVQGDEARAPYRTLSAADAAAPATASMVVVFEPLATEAEIRRALRDAGARIVGGPTQSNGYLLDVPPEKQQEALRALKADRRILVAEPLR